MALKLKGEESILTLNGGYLILRIDNKDFHITGVPSPNLLGTNNHDSISHNHEEVEDDEGNMYHINVSSSNVGVDWSIDIHTAQNDQQFDLEKRIAVEYLANEN